MKSIIDHLKIHTNKFLQVFGVLIIISCNQGNKSVNDPICGLATPIVLNSDTIDLNLNDYFTDPKAIENIQYPVGLQTIGNIDSFNMILVRDNKLPFLSIIDFSVGKNIYSILVKNMPKEKIVIQFDPQKKRVKNVKVRGSLNAWNALASKMKQNGRVWEETFLLSPGEYQYLLVVDGKEMRDPANSESISNNMGGANSLLKVGKYKQEDLPFIQTHSFNNNSIILKTETTINGIYAFWQNRIAETEIKRNKIVVKIPDDAQKIKRSYIRAVGFDDYGISNDILIPLEYGKIVTDPTKLTRFDRQTMIIYFMMVDRFKNGTNANDKPVNDPEVLPKVNYYGGDIMGITKEINEGYFINLGINTLWLSPITQNPLTAYGLIKKPRTRFSGYHGYWPISSIRIDSRFGTCKEFQELVDTAHAANMNVLLDYVAHHVHELHPVYRQHPDWVTNLYLPDGSLNTEKWDEYRLTTWFDNFLPTLDTRRPEVVNPMTDSALYWISKYRIDGFRHDATKHVDELFWRTLTHKLKLTTTCSPMIYQIGETYGSRELIGSYISSGMLDAQFDFNVYDDAVASFANKQESFVRLKNSLNESLRYFGYHNLMGYITGNQDRPRFISYAGGDLSFTEDTKLAGWKRNIGVGDSTGYDKLILLHAFNLTIPGIPVIYYGDEFGMPGANDPDNRRMMKFDSLSDDEANVKKIVTKLNHIRSSSMELLYGDLRFIQASDNLLIFTRNYFDRIALVFFNKGDKFENIKVSLQGINGKEASSAFGQKFSLQSDTLIIDLKPISFEIISLK
jgi:cyclomaltodextrinase / maltogenic alpha-amylase / neopullulanase